MKGLRLIRGPFLLSSRRPGRYAVRSIGQAWPRLCCAVAL